MTLWAAARHPPRPRHPPALSTNTPPAFHPHCSRAFLGVLFFSPSPHSQWPGGGVSVLQAPPFCRGQPPRPLRILSVPLPSGCPMSLPPLLSLPCPPLTRASCLPYPAHPQELLDVGDVWRRTVYFPLEAANLMGVKSAENIYMCQFYHLNITFESTGSASKFVRVFLRRWKNPNELFGRPNICQMWLLPSQKNTYPISPVE